MPLSGNSTDKWLKKSDLMKLPNEPRSEKQVSFLQISVTFDIFL